MYGRTRLRLRRSDFWWIIAITIVLLLLAAWTLMLMAGNAHAWDHALPTMSFTDAFGIVFPVFFVGSLIYWIMELLK